MRRPAAALAFALACGLAIGWVDSRPTWDDTGVTVAAVLVAAGIAGRLAPRWFWLAALAVGLPTPLFELPSHGAFAALVFAFAGAGIGAAIAAATTAAEVSHGD